MDSHYFLSLLLCLATGVLAPLAAWAAQVEALNAAFAAASGNPQLTQQLIEDTRRYFYKNPDALKTGPGRALAQKALFARNMQKVQDEISKCSSENVVTQGAEAVRAGVKAKGERLLSIMGQLGPESLLPMSCGNGGRGRTIDPRILDPIVSLSTTASRQDLRNLISAETIEMAAEKYVQILSRFSARSDADNMVREFCGGREGHRACTPEEAEYLKRMAAAVPQHTGRDIEYAKAAIKANKTIETLNTELEKVEKLCKVESHVCRPAGQVFSCKDTRTLLPRGRTAYERYVAAYTGFAGSPEGFLFFTKTIQSEVGKFKTLKDLCSDRSYVSGTAMYSPIRHTPLSYDVQKYMPKAIEEAKNSLLRSVHEARRLSNRTDDYGENSEGISSLVKSNPAAVARALLRSPENAWQVCVALQNIEEDEKFREEILQSVMIGTTVAGIVLLPLGIGAPIWGASAGVTMAIAAAGTLVGLTGTVVSASEARHYYNERESLRSSLIAGAGGKPTAQQIEELKTVSDAYQSALTSAVLNGVFSAADVGILAASTGPVRALTRAAAEDMSKTFRYLTTFKATESEKRVLGRLLALTRGASPERAGKFVRSMSQFGSPARARIVAHFENLSETARAKKMDEFLEVCQAAGCAL